MTGEELIVDNTRQRESISLSEEHFFSRKLVLGPTALFSPLLETNVCDFCSGSGRLAIINASAGSSSLGTNR